MVREIFSAHVDFLRRIVRLETVIAHIVGKNVIKLLSFALQIMPLDVTGPFADFISLAQVWSCRKNMNDTSKCKTVIWFDEEDRVRRLIPPSMIAPRTPTESKIYNYFSPSSKKRKETPRDDHGSFPPSDDDNGPPRSPSPSERKAKKPKNTDIPTENHSSIRRSLFGDRGGRDRNEPRTSSENDRNSFSRRTPNPPATPPRHSQNNKPPDPVTPPGPKRCETGLFTPQTTEKIQKAQSGPGQLRALPKSSYFLQAKLNTLQDAETSDSDTYDWSDDLEMEARSFAEIVEKSSK